MKRSIAVVLAAAALFGPAAARAADPSTQCEAGAVPASATPAGAGARITDEPMTATVTVCLANATAPYHGSVKAKASAAEPSALVSVDGDPSAAALGCSDGYAAAAVRGDGVSLYYAGDGGFTSRARAKSPGEIAGAAAHDCTLTPASA